MVKVFVASVLFSFVDSVTGEIKEMDVHAVFRDAKMAENWTLDFYPRRQEAWEKALECYEDGVPAAHCFIWDESSTRELPLY